MMDNRESEEKVKFFIEPAIKMDKTKLPVTKPITSQTIIDEVFKANSIFAKVLKKDKKILSFSLDMINKGYFMCGLDWANIIEHIRGMQEFKLIDTPVDTLDEYTALINEYKRVMIQLEGGKDLTLDRGKSIIKQYFSNLYSLEQMFFEEGKKEIGVRFLLMR